MNSRSAKNLAHNLRRGIREVGYMVYAPGKARKLDRDIAAVKLNRESRGESVEPGLGAKPKNYSEARSREVMMARGRVREIKSKLPLK